MKKYIFGLIFLMLISVASIANAQYYPVRYRQSADCDALTDGITYDVCFETGTAYAYKCFPTSGNCDTPGEWALLNDGDSDTNANTECTGTTTYLDGEGNCDDISSVYQPLDSDLTTYAGITPSANVQSLLGAADYGAMRALLDLEAGTDFYSISAADAAFQPLDADLTDLADGSLTGTKVGFADTDSNFTATDIQSAIEEFDDVNGLGPNATDGKVDWSQLVNVPAGFADGTDATGAGGSAIVFDIGDDGGNDSTDVNEIATSGDTNSIFTEPTADKIYINLAQNWPGADTATALAANGSNCSSGSAPLGVDASGAVESCFDVWTEAENTSAAYIANVSEDTTPQLGGDLDSNTNNIVLSTGTAIQTGTTATNTALLQAYDVDGLVYVTFATLTANNTPTFDLATSTTVGGASIQTGTDDDVPESGDFGAAGDLEADGTLSADVVAAAEMADADHGDISWSGGVASIDADAVALTTDTTGNYVASITNGTSITGADGGSEGAALTLDVADDSINGTELADAITLDATTTIDMDTNTADLNFDSNTLFIDQSTNRVGIGTSTPTTELDVNGEISTTTMTVTDNFEIPNSTTLPATCSVGMIYMDTDATSGQRIYACESTNTWALQGDGGAGGGDSVSIDSVAVTDPDFVSTGDIDFVDTSNTITANINSGVIVNADINASAAIDISKTALVAGTNITLSTNTLNVDDAFLSNAGDVGTGVYDFGGADSLEIPNSATPTTDATGEIALDTTITDHQPLLQYYDGGENMTVIAIDTSQLPALDNEIIKYDAATDKFVLEADAGGGSGAFSDASDPVVLNTTTKDVVIGTNAVNTSKLTIDGDADQVQLTVQGNGTQTDSVIIVETSAGTETLNIEADGTILTAVGIDVIGAVDMDYGSADVTDHTFTTDGTGDAEIVLPTGSIGSTEILDATIVTGDIAADTITHANIADADQADTKCAYIEDPVAESFVSFWANKTANDFQITEYWAESDQTISVDLQVDDGTPADCDASPITPASGEAEDTSISGDCLVAAGEELDLVLTSPSGTPTYLIVCFTGNWVD